MESKGNDALLTSTKISEFNLNHGGFIPVAFGFLLLAGCAAAYVIAVTRGNVEPILPLISDAAGSPPQNGIFGTLISVGGMLGVIFMIQRYMIIGEKNRGKSTLVAALNKLCLYAGIVSMFGITLVTGYPLNFYRNRDVWYKDVGLPHMIGGVMLFALGLVYIALQCAITILLKTKNECTLTIRALLFLACTVAFVYHMMTVPDNFGGISHLYYINSTEMESNTTNLSPFPSTLGIDLKLPIDTGGSYFTSAVAEWAFVVCFCCYFFTFYSETQEYSVQIVIETHTAQDTEHADETKIEYIRRQSLHQAKIEYIRKPSVHQKIEVKAPPPEMRKFLRRDSTCQTTERELENSKQRDRNPVHRNGTKNSLLDSKLDAKLHKLLQEVDKDSPKTNGNSTQHSISTSTNDDSTRDIVKNVEKEMSEAERSIIEKIESVVKKAEEETNSEAEKPKNGATKVTVDDEEKPSNCPLAVQ